jgi:oligopeptide transport system ATP-binding protein
MVSDAILKVEHLSKYFTVNLAGRKMTLKAVDDVSFEVPKGATLGIVGESGSGKTTLLRTIALLYTPTSGRITFNGEVIFDSDKRIMKRQYVRGLISMVYQDPESELNPTMRIIDIVAEPLEALRVPRDEALRRAEEAIREVGLSSDILLKRPLQLSGGQKQRVAVARAIVTNPLMVLLDEPTSNLDVVVQAGILNLLLDLQKTYNLTYILVTHNLAVAQYMSDYLAVFYTGRMYEWLPATDEPKHPYAKALADAFPTPDPFNRKILNIEIKGEVPSMLNLPSGCTFHPRCPYAMDVCREKAPQLKSIGNGHLVACHLY